MKHKKKRIFFYSLLVLSLTFLVFDLYCEIYTLPSSIEKAIERKFQEKGILISIKNARAGIFHGVVLDNVKVMESKYSSSVLFTAESLRFSLPLSFRGVLVDKFSIHGGNLNLPLFPEAGEEGLTDMLRFQNIEAKLERRQNHLEIIYANTFLNGFLLNISGEVRDVFTDVGFMMPVPAGMGDEEIAPSSYLSMVPLNAREYFQNEIRDIRRSAFSKMPLLQIRLNIGMKDPAKNTLDCKLQIPSFKSRNQTVEEITGNLSLKDKNLHLDNLSVSFGKNGRLKARGDLDLSSMTFKGLLDGKLLVGKFLSAEDFPVMNDILLSNRLSDIEVIVGNYSITTFSGNLSASVSIPELDAFKIHMKDVKMSTTVSFDEKEKPGIRIDKARLTFNQVEYLDFSGELNHRAKSLSGDFSGKVMPTRFHAALDEKTRAEIDQVLVFGKEPFSFSGHLDKFSRDFKDIHASVLLKLASLRIYESDYKDISARVSLDGARIRASDIKASTPAGNSIDGELEYCMPDDHFFISLHSTGNPAFVCKTSTGKARKTLDELYGSVSWPEKNESVEMTARINFFMKPTPCYNLVGNIVLCDFAYKGVKFDYGAASFIVDSDNMNLLPRIVLQQGKDSALISLAYDNRQDPALFPAAKALTVPAKGTDKLYFDIDSTLPGNSILKIIIPAWDHARLDMSGTSPLKLSGMIDFVDDNGTRFEGRLDDAKGEWSGIPMENVTATISMKDQELEIKDFTAEVFNGKVIFSYNYNLAKKTGKMSLNIEDSDFAPLVQNLGFKDFSSKKPGSISGDMIAALQYNEKDELLMDGKGKMAVRDANIFDIPVLKGFTDMMGTSVISSEWGEISSAECNFTLEKDHFFSDSIQTNGNAVALSAVGKYYWNTSESDFKVRAKILKNMLPFELLSKLSHPLSWALEARIHGKGKDLEWEQGTGLKRLFK